VAWSVRTEDWILERMYDFSDRPIVTRFSCYGRSGYCEYSRKCECECERAGEGAEVFQWFDQIVSCCSCSAGIREARHTSVILTFVGARNSPSKMLYSIMKLGVDLIVGFCADEAGSQMAMGELAATMAYM
jgi:hypothetical protein